MLMSRINFGIQTNNVGPDQNLFDHTVCYRDVLQHTSELAVIRSGRVKTMLSRYDVISFDFFFMPPKELWEAYSNRTVRPSVRPTFVSGPYLLYFLR